MFCPCNGLGDASLSLSDLTAVADYQAANPGDTVPAGGVSYLWTAADQAALDAGLPASYTQGGVSGFLKSNTTLLLGGAVVLALIFGGRHR